MASSEGTLSLCTHGRGAVPKLFWGCSDEGSNPSPQCRGGSRVARLARGRSAADRQWTALVVFEAMIEPTVASGAEDPLGEQIRRLRLRADGQRPLAVNLSETIALTRKLFELREAAQRAR
jgi:hypothetical protein